MKKSTLWALATVGLAVCAIYSVSIGFMYEAIAQILAAGMTGLDWHTSQQE